MSSTNKTPNYALPQFIPTDKPTWLGDVNAAMLAIDTAMADNHTTAESANTSASAAVAQVQHAVDTANEAKVDSAAALQNATNAIGVAQNALNSATQATQTAQAATQTANAANNSAASAVATANQAKQTADTTDAKLTEFEHKDDIYLLSGTIGSISGAKLEAVFYGRNGLLELAFRNKTLQTGDEFQINFNLWSNANNELYFQTSENEKIHLIITSNESGGNGKVTIQEVTGAVISQSYYKDVIMFLRPAEYNSLVANNRNRSEQYSHNEDECKAILISH